MGSKITFHGGINEIGGNKFLVEDKGTKIFMDFGMSFSAEKKYFAEFLNARNSNSLIDMLELGLLPNVKGLYRRDYARHMGFDGYEETEIDAMLLTHAHTDHCAYIPYLREDIPIYCSEESRLVLQNFDDTGDEEYLTLKEKFQVYTNKKGEISRATGDKVQVPRKVHVFESAKSFSIDSIQVEPLPVDHSIPGVHAFILHTSSGSIANTADLRFHGRRSDETEKFVDKCSESSLDLLLCEGTRVDKSSPYTEYDVEKQASKIIKDTEKLVICNYPVRDLDRFLSFYNAVKESGRKLVIDFKQAYLLKLFQSSPNLKSKYPSPTDKYLEIYVPRGKWGLVDKDLAKFSERQLLLDYEVWQQEFVGYPNSVDYRDVSKNQKESVLFCSDFKLQDLIDLKPDAGSSYIRSSTEPFDVEMRLKEKQIKNWLERFGIITKERDWHQIHVSGHGDKAQIKKIVEGSKPKRLIPVHTVHADHFKEWHNNVTIVTDDRPVDL